MAERLAEIRSRIATAARASGRTPDAVTLIAVSKLQPASAIVEAQHLGLTDFGENYAQELLAKAAAIGDVRWHFIGRFQKNKINALKAHVHAWHTLGDETDADALAKRVGCVPSVLLQVNIGREPQKGGLVPEAVEQVVDAIRAEPRLLFRGLMCIPPAEGPAEGWFLAMAELNARVRGAWLSMGMSDDYEMAIRYGATHVRIGTALFGRRP